MKKLNDLTSHLFITESIEPINPTITSLHMDSRSVETGGLFFCIRGYTVDGHDYAISAESSGAAAIVTEEQLDVSIPQIIVKDTKRAMAVIANVFYDHPTRSFRLIGVTGTNGKTTTSHLIDAILKENDKKTGLIGTMYTKIGEIESETVNTTPESLPLQQLFSDMVAEEVDTCVMEVSSHALDLGRVRGCAFNTAVFTNLTPEHLDYHGTMDAYKQAKGLLFAQLGNTYDGPVKTAVLNGDDPASTDYKRMTSVPVLTYGMSQHNDIHARKMKMTPGGSFFELVTPWGDRTLRLSLVGRFSVYNALAAAAACLAEGLELNTIVSALERVTGVRGRFEPVDAGQSFAVVVDYAHTADSLENVLQTIQEMAEGDIYVVVGCGGDRDKAKRPEMARVALEYSTHAIFTSDNPRNEDPLQILNQMTEGISEAESYNVEIDRDQAIRSAVKQAKANDIVLIAGKGHETYQIIGSQVTEFDDRAKAYNAIKELKK
ncbi:UDP-N-acetylmuramoyl-L-alanyl-D-glutamate--2,6-diaminopimelate ligase [Salibacterium salarium]|uniref:UDP-N-acetylmuramoyl-L-alanyl-D-glutamate--2,6-diaminopimelate ligase n=1 Tax=Salibacterium salarium TaxID=284579 RepID=A0A428MYZ5_9BACI|nr:UDP-N-acetylmuramoyl-L-alanyl-D-glutamate--2,6-diaminopimelate ligase [Salibacterium salarium]RSL31342.1 UDP-N-acetylmuramoyl-L-alanyl-D-glutamate--2,6-diaminopimelate ligase [Salibacterium salarium]